jgi:hypothetical protein
MADVDNSNFPRAVTEIIQPKIQRRGVLALLLFLLLALSVLGLLAYHYWHRPTVSLTLYFQQGHGLKIGDALRYRGIDIGVVHSVQLTEQLDRIEVNIKLAKNATDVATEKSQFWIVRPQVDMTTVGGLETLLGANYINVLPGRINDAEDPFQFKFTGLETAPALAILETGGLSIDLMTTARGNLKVNAPVLYRDVKIGTILAVDLTPNGRAVRAQVYIQPDYVGLIRQQTRFWKTSGLEMGVGWSGFSMNIGSFQSLLLGGITLAVPPEPGALAHYGQQFTLHDKPENEWLEWETYAPLNSEAENYPKPLLAVLTWQRRNLLRFTVDERRTAWVLPLAENQLLVPSSIVTPPSDALPETAQLTIAGQVIEIKSDSVSAQGSGDLSMLSFPHGFDSWTSRRHATVPENTLIIANPDHSPIYIASHQYENNPAESAEIWLISKETPMREEWHGAAVIAEKDQALLGILLVESGRGKVILWSE